ncbi:MAG: BON domain-containing protein [Deltaproteobacteria bacterium]|nr:BON domain-containing protein [Deltaproteobacteria bacterium]
MKKISFILLISVFAVSSVVAESERSEAGKRSGSIESQRSAVDRETDFEIDERARYGGAEGLTADNQSDHGSDALVARIRRSLLNDDSLSFNAHNIKIISLRPGEVTLKGTVESANERRRVKEIAQSHAEAVEDQLIIRKEVANR